MAGNKEDYTGDSSTTNGSTNNSTSTEQTSAIKYIQKKSAVKPLTGKIVNTVNIDDKTTNTYSASIIDQKIAAGAPSEDSGDSVFVSQILTSGTKIGTITVNDVGTDLYAPTPSAAGTITTQVKSYTSGEFSVYDTNAGISSFTATGPGTGWYPTCATVPHGSGTTTLGSGIYSHGITMTSAGNNTCNVTIYVSGNAGNASTHRGTCKYYITWAKIS